MRFFLVESKSCFHAGDFVARKGAIASIYRRPASLDLGLACRWSISRARRQIESVALCVWQCHLRNVSTLSNRTRARSSPTSVSISSDASNTYLTLLSRWRLRWRGAPRRRGSFVTARRAKYPRRPRRVASERGRRRTAGHRRKGVAVQRPAPKAARVLRAPGPFGRPAPGRPHQVSGIAY